MSGQFDEFDRAIAITALGAVAVLFCQLQLPWIGAAFLVLQIVLVVIHWRIWRRMER